MNPAVHVEKGKARSVAVVVAGFVMALAVGSVARAESSALPMFDGHLHPMSDDTTKYPHHEQAMGGPGGPGSAPPGGPPPGSGPGGPNGGPSGGPGGPPQGEHVVPDFDKRALKWMDDEHVAAAAAVQRRGTYGTDNRYTLDISEAHPTRLRAVVVLDAEDPKSVGELQAMITKRHAAGVRLTGTIAADGSTAWLNSDQARKVWEVVNNAGGVVDLMITSRNSAQAIPRLINLGKTYPNARIVIDHVLSPNLQSGADYGIDATYAQLSQQKNLYFKFTNINLGSQPTAITQGFVRRLVQVYGADHVLWGSDAGNSPGSYHELVNRIVESAGALTEAERKQVLHDTGDAVFVSGGTRPAH